MFLQKKLYLSEYTVLMVYISLDMTANLKRRKDECWQKKSGEFREEQSVVYVSRGGLCIDSGMNVRKTRRCIHTEKIAIR